MNYGSSSIVRLVLVMGLTLLTPAVAVAHCDTFSGPVLIEAQAALKTGNVTPLLKWVPEKHEKQIKTAFSEVLQKRGADPQTADASFFEILVRIHREGEGASFSGVKTPGTVLPPAILAADKALAVGSSQALIGLLAKDLVRSVRSKYHRAMEKKRLADHSVAEGREYVAAYIEYVHYVEAISNLLSEKQGHGSEGTPKTPGACSTSGASCGGHKE